MFICFLIGIVSLYLLRNMVSQDIKWNEVVGYLIPYWQRGDYVERLLGVLQLFLIGCISFCVSLKIDEQSQRGFVFALVFLSMVWLIRVILCIMEWLQEYIKTMTVNILFTLIVPIAVLINIRQIDGYFEIEICLGALLMSLVIVYMELVSIVLGKGNYKIAAKYLVMSSASKLKSILTWFFIILLNLYTLVLFIQFYIETSTYHFIEEKILNKASAVDLFYYLVVTFTTVGFGDISPHTLIAKLISAVIALSGMLFTGIFVGCILNIKE